MHTFFWHDYETWGTDPKSDRPAQFAGIRTDADLNEIGEPIMIYCKPPLDALPTPQSCLLTGLTPQYCQQQGLREYQFAAFIEQQLAEENTIGVGFNSIRFDDEVTRFLFWRNLIDPYAREWKNGCGRWDLLDVVRALYVFKPKALTWPVNEVGLINFKLEALSKANGLFHESAHDALSDVQATLGLARLIKNIEPRFFDFCLALRNKDQVRTQLSLQQRRPLLHISGMYGGERAYLAAVWPLAIHPFNKNEVLVWDLHEDPQLLANLDVATIKLRLFTRKEDLPADVSRLPIKTLSLNKSPFVINNLRVLSEERAAELKIDLAKVAQHAARAQKLDLPETLWHEVYTRAPYPSVDVDEDLYSGFIPDKDRYLLERLRRLNSESLAKENCSFQDLRLKELLFRYRARNFPETLSAQENRSWQQHCWHKYHQQYEGFWQQLNTCYANATLLQKALLDELKSWVSLLEPPVDQAISSSLMVANLEANIE